MAMVPVLWSRYDDRARVAVKLGEVWHRRGRREEMNRTGVTRHGYVSPVPFTTRNGLPLASCVVVGSLILLPFLRLLLFCFSVFFLGFSLLPLLYFVLFVFMVFLFLFLVLFVFFGFLYVSLMLSVHNVNFSAHVKQFLIHFGHFSHNI